MAGRAGLLLRFAALGAIAGALTGCVSMAPGKKTPELITSMPDALSVEGAGELYAPDSWWTAFEDPILDALVEEALRNNLDVAQSVARLEQARAQARLTQSRQVPSVDASFSASESSTPIAGSAFGDLGGSGLSRIENETYSPSVSISYELDLFARNRNDEAAARRDAIATEYDLEAVRLASAAEVIATYFEIVNVRRQIELTVLTTDVLEDRSNRTETQFERGLADSFELYQIRQQLRATQASLPQLESGLTDAENRLSLLLAKYPGAIDDQLAHPLLPRLVFEPVPAGLPSQLLTRRPDVAAAWARLDAARLRIGARRAERFPQINLSGSLGGQSDDISGAFNFADNWTRSLAASVVAPIFNAGRITASIRTARAQYDEVAAVYASTVLRAFQEVDSAASDYEDQRRRYRIVTAQLNEAKLSLDLQKRRFEAGVGTYLAYLDALTTVYQVEADLSAAAQATALSRLNLHRALAGDWAPEIQPIKPEMVPTKSLDGPNAAVQSETPDE